MSEKKRTESHHRNVPCDDNEDVEERSVSPQEDDEEHGARAHQTRPPIDSHNEPL